MNSKIKLPPPHKVAPMVQYAFTVNLNGHDDLPMMTGRYGAFFKRISPLVYFSVFPELSTVARKLHYHGWITFKSWASIMLFYDWVGLRRDEFAMEIDFINWNDANIFKNWYTYCLKDRHIMEPYMLFKKLPYHLFNECDYIRQNGLHMNIKDALLHGLASEDSD